MNAEMAQIESGDAAQGPLYAAASAAYAPAIARLARAVEADADRARDLEQGMHLRHGAIDPPLCTQPGPGLNKCFFGFF